MRRAAVLLLLIAPGCGTRTCKHDTALATFALADELVADALDVSISIDGAPPSTDRPSRCRADRSKWTSPTAIHRDRA